jgi:hypothetical protein
VYSFFHLDTLGRGGLCFVVGSVLLSLCKELFLTLVKGIMNIEIGTRVRVKGRGNTIFTLADKSSPVRYGDWWVVRKSNGALVSVRSSNVKPVVAKVTETCGFCPKDFIGYVTMPDGSMPWVCDDHWQEYAD